METLPKKEAFLLLLLLLQVMMFNGFCTTSVTVFVAVNVVGFAVVGIAVAVAYYAVLTATAATGL